MREGGGAKGGKEKVRSFVTFSYRWTPCDISFIFVISCDKLLGCFFMVDPLVFLQVGCLDWGIVTLVALVWLLSCVRLNVSFKCSSCGGRIVALWTFVRFLSAMNEKMFPQSSSSAEWFVAYGTTVWLLTSGSVGQNVIPQMSVSTEWFAAISTFVQFISTVYQQLPFQISILTRCFVASCTFMQHLSSVNEQVYLKISSQTERFVAFCTIMWLCPSVCQHVPGQFSGKSKGLVTHWTVVFVFHFEDRNCSSWLLDWTEEITVQSWYNLPTFTFPFFALKFMISWPCLL